ncbi:choline transporter-like protein 2 [Uloborus diversus]|uniref:choline transporter-like protein 2 n=1 Tax=Uloborus diversus TaxID=327109 RepID=UPI0024099899|nr:choline transporter-like protein 2 [Uloborus diversus]
MKSSETPVVNNSEQNYGESLTYDPEFKGPVKNRYCTDILCLFFFVAFIAGWIVVGYFAFREGDPRVLLYPTDSEGNMCGIGKLQNKSFLFYFDLMKCANPSVLINGCPTPQVCVEQCPNETFLAHPNDPQLELKKPKFICKYDARTDLKSAIDLVKDEDCAMLYLKSTSVEATHFAEDLPHGMRDIFVGRCVPEIFLKAVPDQPLRDEFNRTISEEITTAEVKKAVGFLARFLSVQEVGEKLFYDFKLSWYFIVIGLLFAMLVSLVWIVLMRWIAGPMIWLSIVIVLGFSAFACYYSTTRYIALKDDPAAGGKFQITLNLKSYLAKKNTWLAFAIITGAVFTIFLLILCFLRKRILIAIALIKEASRAVGSMFTALLFPVIPYLFMSVFIAFWIAVALYIASSGKASFIIADAPEGSGVENGTICNPSKFINNATTEGMKCLFQTYGLKDNLFSAHVYNTFGLFWGLFFSIGLGQVSLAGAFASYYWTQDKKNVSSFSWVVGFYRCMRYHMGSVAFGSLIIAVVRMIRVMLEYVDQKCKKYDNQFTKVILWCMKCCFWCLEKFLRFISKNAYIMIAVYGKNFCVSAKRAFMLLMRNVVRVVVLDKITDFLLFIGKLVVVAFTATISFYLFATEQKIYKGIPSLNFNLLPPIFITLGSYLIASAFFNVYGMAVDTLFLCFLEDCERNDGSPEKPYYMSKELMKILDKRNKFRDPKSSP